MITRHIHETRYKRSGGSRRLGRHVEHDPASRSFSTPHAFAPLKSAKWPRSVLPFDQGELGSCTANAVVGCIMSMSSTLMLTENDCVSLYEQSTLIDTIPGHYPPDDTGSSGLAACKAAKARGWISKYHHAFAMHSVLASLGHGPGALGINWYESFDSPVGDSAELVIAGSIRGGHEVEVMGIDVDGQTIQICNSWGEDWGDHGYCTMSFSTLDRLLHEQGDYVIPSL